MSLVLWFIAMLYESEMGLGPLPTHPVRQLYTSIVRNR